MKYWRIIFGVFCQIRQERQNKFTAKYRRYSVLMNMDSPFILSYIHTIQTCAANNFSLELLDSSDCSLYNIFFNVSKLPGWCLPVYVGACKIIINKNK